MSSSVESRQARSRDVVVVIAALVWLLAFGGHFFARPLADDPQLGRVDVLADSGWLLLDNVLPTPGQSQQSGWRYFPQRFDLLAVAAAMLASIWSAGQLSLRCMRIEPAARSERIVLAFGLGISAWTLVTLALGVAGLLSRWLFVALMLATIGAELLQRSRRARKTSGATRSKRGAPALAERRFLEGPRLPVVICLLVAPFLLAMLLGAMLPTTDFDVKEYHLQGPKEWFQQGRITFLPHNAYTSFPFLTEMLSLWGMVLRGDWFRGALIGQVVLFAFAPLTAVATFAVCRNVSTTAGWIGAGVFLTIPWVYRISVIAYTEGGLTFFLAATFLAWQGLRHAPLDSSGSRRVLLCGLLAGSAMGCKYPGLVSVTAPIGLAVVWTVMGTTWRGSRDAGARTSLPDSPSANKAGGGGMRAVLLSAAVFSLGVAITFGPWALKNLLETGNPVYPLAYTIFGGRDWTPELNEKWRNGHKGDLDWHNPAGIPADLRKHAEDVAVNSVWQSPLVFGLAPLALLSLWPRRREGEASAEPLRRLTFVLIIYAAYLFLTWWGLTHRIDRFWLPMLPIVCALAGIGGAEFLRRQERLLASGKRAVAMSCGLLLTCLSILATAYNLALTTSAMSGFNGYLLDETVARRIAMQQTPSVAVLTERLPPGARVLSVGEAAVFDAQFELRYNTVFDFELLQDWTTDDPFSLHRPDIPLKSREEILARLKAEGITHVFVNWLEILRYREPSSYTYTDFISPRTLQKLVDLGVLVPVPLTPQEGMVMYENLSAGKQGEVDRWGPELRSTYFQDGEAIPVVAGYALYTVAE